MSNFSDPEQICEQILKAAAHSTPPTDLNTVCSLWPDLKVDEEDLDKEGYLIPLGVHGAEILLRKSDSPARKKFTLAHELGHWTQAHLIADQVYFNKTNRPSMSFQTHHKRHTPEEVWCNKFAACLLMPKRDVCSYLQGSGNSNLADRISRGHLVFQVSPEAFLTRISDIMPINVFEVVSAGSGAKIRRSFFSKHLQGDRTEEVMNELLYVFRETDNPFKELLVVDNYQFQARLTHSSQYSRSWLVSVTPVTNQ